MINFDKLRKYLKSLSYEDFRNIDNDNSKIEEAWTVDDVAKFRTHKKIKKDTLVNYGEYFLVDILGNDLTVVKLTRKKYKTPKGRLVNAKIVKTIVEDCNRLYGSCINGYFHIPKDCYK